MAIEASLFKIREEMAPLVHGFLEAAATAASGDARAQEEQNGRLRDLDALFWRGVDSIVASSMSRSSEQLEFTDEERLFIDFGLVDIRMPGGNPDDVSRDLLTELRLTGPSNCFYLSEWLANRHNQIRLEGSVAAKEADPVSSYASQLVETRKRILSRLSVLFTGLPGVPRGIADAMCSGALDNEILETGIGLLADGARPGFLRRRGLWLLREQILSKARARADGQTVLKMFEILNEVYVRDWRERYDRFVQTFVPTTDADHVQDETTSLDSSAVRALLSELRQIRMRIRLESLANGETHSQAVLAGAAPRLNKESLGGFLPVVQTMDRDFSDLPPILIVPGSGRGLGAWESGLLMLCLRPPVGVEDSVATAFAYQRMADDCLNNAGRLRRSYEHAFPGANFNQDFPIDYRAWLCRLSRGDVSAMKPDKRAFFRDNVGPDIRGPMAPANLKAIGPQTREIICRRLEKQISSGESDVNLHRRLGALYWLEGNLDAAQQQFALGVKIAPKDGELLFSFGVLMRHKSDPVAANMFFRYGSERSADTIWGVYCKDALENLL